MLSLCLIIKRHMRVTPLGFCLGVIVDEKPLNLKKTKSSILSVIMFLSMYSTLIYVLVLEDYMEFEHVQYIIQRGGSVVLIPYALKVCILYYCIVN